ncbi:4Fe-4S ferredoxin, iron-sulfur binding protein [Anaeromyxobacter sp. K]|uniref:4Fe-4S ferredoxin, iron-sulfur binding protein n=1 Tax=Anaeromyxobacter dehalogenans (strain ATCC BAA-258 / DSM 21875 / 2CP-1) TaxID=455488 RepID=B8JA16_ANAD2|nr:MULTISPECIES: 4Fe-4S dicluster domain-containing protein [Anaeromyxobacter]ACG71591.1 4Fe-4S ferredoxin, iron-sulfur binding protein [Anaeromyxobacter sp. K]ACL63719.1 4Fe-4S ferredoxin, iron-sulfur binding protein [Anaeromyxobacter dehalogenans 2CP-1]
MFEAMEIAVVLLPVVLVAGMVVRLVARGHTQVLLCMECELCMGACPLCVKRGEAFPGPKGILAAAKTGKVDAAIAAGALDCTSCGACTHVCPRGLAPQREVERWRAEAERVASRHAAEDPA